MAEQRGSGEGEEAARGRQYDEIVTKACLFQHIKAPCMQKLRDVIRNCVDSYPGSVRNASLGLMHIPRERYRDVTDIRTVEVSEEFFDKTLIRHLILGTGETSTKNELVHALHENFAEYG